MSFRLSITLAALACAASPALAQTPPAGPPRTASVNTGPRVDVSAMPRIQAPSDGASQRLAVSPGREAEGYFHMPGGQSGHPLSPHYRDGHADWAEGRPAPFLPGETRDVLELRP